jgi:hypothetical protein
MGIYLANVKNKMSLHVETYDGASGKWTESPVSAGPRPVFPAFLQWRGKLRLMQITIRQAFDKNPALGAAFRSLVEREGHIDFLDRVRFMTIK